MGQAKLFLQKRLVTTRMDQMPRKKLEWLWPQRIALGTLTVLAGGFGSGKSLLAADLAARVSRGEAWPDGRPGLGPSQVLMLNHDDHPQCTSDDMLQAAGADMTRVVSPEEVEEGRMRLSVVCGKGAIADFGLGIADSGSGNDGGKQGEGIEGLGFDKLIPGENGAGELNAENAEGAEKTGGGRMRGAECGSEEEDGMEEFEVVKRRPINLKVDLDALEEQLAGMKNCRLVIIDPIDAHLSGGNTVAARMWLRSLMVIAAKYRVAMVLLTYLKEGRKSPLYRLMGGMGLAGAARAVWVVEREPGVRGQESGVKGEELSVVGCQLPVGERRLLLGVKNNLSGVETGLAFRLVVEEERGVPRVEWSSEVVTETAEEVMEQLRQQGAKPSYAVSRAMEFLQEALAAGPRLMREVLVEAKEREGISRSSLERARKEMKVRAFRKVVPGAWWICLKEDEAWKQEPIAAVEVVEGLGKSEGERTTENTEDTKTMRGGEAARGEGLDDVDGLGFDKFDTFGKLTAGRLTAGKLTPGENGAGEENAENAEDAEFFDEGVDGVERLAGVECVEGVEGVGFDKLSPGSADDEVLDEKTLAAMEAFVRSPWRFGELEEEQQALLRALIMNDDRFEKYWSVVHERLEVVEGVEELGFDKFDTFGKLTAGRLTAGKLIPGENGAGVGTVEGAAERIALRKERRRKLAQKMRRIKKERQKQRKLQRRR